MAYVQLRNADGEDEGAQELHDAHQEDRRQQLLRPVNHQRRRLDEVGNAVACDVVAAPAQPHRSARHLGVTRAIARRIDGINRAATFVNLPLDEIREPLQGPAKDAGEMSKDVSAANHDVEHAEDTHPDAGCGAADVVTLVIDARVRR